MLLIFTEETCVPLTDTHIPYIYLHMLARIYIYIYIRMHACSHACTCACSHIQYTYIHMHAHIHAHTHAHTLFAQVYVDSTTAYGNLVKGQAGFMVWKEYDVCPTWWLVITQNKYFPKCDHNDDALAELEVYTGKPFMKPISFWQSCGKISFGFLGTVTIKGF